jgi:hypothetical protein
MTKETAPSKGRFKTSARKKLWWSGGWRVESGEWRVESREWRVESGEWREGRRELRTSNLTGVN